MKIAMIGQKGIPALSGGVERHVEEISKRLVQQGNEVTVYCRSTYADKRRPDFEGVKLKYINTFNNKSTEAIIYSLKASFTSLFLDYDLIHYHAIGPASMAFIPKFLNRKIVVTVHGLDWQRDKWGRIAKTYLKFGEKVTGVCPEKIISVSENLRDYFIEKYHKSKDDVFFIPNGVNIIPGAEIDEIQKWGLKKDGYLLFLARIVPEKGLHYLISAYQNLQTDKKLVIAGDASYTDNYLEKLKASCVGNQNIIFTGRVQGKVLHELYSNAYLYILPSDVEGMPITLLEAMSFAKCCLTSNIPENSGVIKKRFGFTFEKANIDDLTQKMAFLLDHSEIVSQTGGLAFAEIQENYNWDSIISKTIDVYQRILSTGNYYGEKEVL